MASDTSLDWWKELVAVITAGVASVLAAIKWAVPIGRSAWQAHCTATDVCRNFGPQAGRKLRQVLQDITYRQDIAEVKARINEEHFGLGIYICKPTGACEMVNKTIADQFGMQAEDMKGYGWLRHVRDSAQAHLKWTTAVHNGLPYNDQYWIDCPDGTAKLIFTEAYLVESDGEPIKYVGVSKVVRTEKKETDER